MKKTITIIIGLMLLICLAGCTVSTKNSGEQSSSSPMSINKEQLTDIKQTFDTAEEQSGVELRDDQIFIPPVINAISEELSVTIEKFDDEALTSINFFQNGVETTKYEIATMGIGEFESNIMYNGYFTIDEWLVSFNPQIFNDGERNYYIYVYDNQEEGSKDFILRYIIKDNTIFNVTGRIKNFDNDVLTEESAKELYEDFKVISLSELERTIS